MFKKYPSIEHILIVGKPGSYKDVTAVKFCYDHFKKGGKVFSNLDLGFSFIKIDSMIMYDSIKGDNWNPSLVYIHDIGIMFHSRDFWKRKGDNIDVRKSFVNNYRKRGLQIVGTLHREEEVDIEIRKIIDWFIYPSCVNIGDPLNMEDDVVILNWFDKPESQINGDKPKMRSFYVHPESYAVLFNTLQEVKLEDISG